jgi:DNA-binding transcriptional LysR family regulator
MDLIDELKAFVATAQTGSFTAAAEQLGVSNRLTSKYVAELESRLGVRLLQRTTRKVGLTPAGEDLLSRAPALLDDLDDLIGEVSEGSRGFAGVIRISASVTFGETYVTGMIDRFGQRNPALSFDLRLTDRHVDLASEGIDVAFRMGRTDTQSLKRGNWAAFPRCSWPARTTLPAREPPWSPRTYPSTTASSTPTAAPPAGGALAPVRPKRPSPCTGASR